MIKNTVDQLWQTPILQQQKNKTYYYWDAYTFMWLFVMCRQVRLPNYAVDFFPFRWFEESLKSSGKSKKGC